MRVKLLFLVAVIGSPIATYAQGAFLYNQGQMVVTGTTSDNTVLFVNGDLISASKKDVVSSDIVGADIKMSDSKMIITGDLIHNLPHNAIKGTVFSTPDPNKPSNAIFEFRGTGNVQTIKTDGKKYADIPDKGSSYINFPGLIINNAETVVVNPEMAVKTGGLSLTKGTLVLTSERIELGAGGNSDKYYPTNQGSSTTPNPNERTAMAVLFAESAEYKNASAGAKDRGFVEVQLELDKSGSYTYVNGRYGSLVGMGIPFKAMKADYFTWNYLLAPEQNTFFGPNKQPISDPTTDLIPGKGYFIGNELLGIDYANYASTDTSIGPWGVIIPGRLGKDKFATRFKGGYVFNRAYFANMAPAATSNNLFGAYSSTNKAYTDEQINTSDVKVTLKKGYNYLANPFTAPLNIKGLLTSDKDINKDWGVIVGDKTVQGRQLYSGVWIVTGSSRGSALYDMNNAPGTDKKLPERSIQASVTTDLALLNNGGTYVDDKSASGAILIPPLQMFVVYSYADGIQITIPAKARTMGSDKFIRSGNVTADDFIFEVVDKKTNSSDRVNVVLRPKSEIVSNARYSNVVKMNGAVNTLDENKIDTEALYRGIASRLYVNGDDNENLLVKYVPYTKDVDSKVAVPLNLLPSRLEQDVILRGLKLNSLTEFDNIILEDKLLNKQVLMTPETEYPAHIKSTDSPNRFVLYFMRGTTGIEDEIDDNTTKSINSYYANGTLTVNGFDENDFGSTLSVFDIQGRLIRQTKVNDFTVTITENFAPGAFIVKVVGNNAYVAKFLVR